MGRDKALLSIDGATFVERIADVARQLTPHVTVVGRPDGIRGIPGIGDLRPGEGPLAGIETALEHARPRHAIVIACDLPFVSADLLSLLWERAVAAPDTIVVPEDAEGCVSPLCGVYPASARSSVSALLDRGERMPRRLFTEHPTDRVPFQAYAHLPHARRLLRNINTPADFERSKMV